MSPQRESERSRLNLTWILGTLVVGGAVLWATIATADSTAQPGLWQSFLVNVGSAVLLSSLLGFIEPRLRKNYIDATERRIEAVTEKAEERFEARVEELAERVESARALFENYMAAEDNTVAVAADGPDFYTIADALVAANRARAIDAFRGIAVPASDSLPAVVVRFHYATIVHGRRRDVLRISPSIVEDRPDGRIWPTLDYEWLPDATADEFGAYLMTELRNAGLKDVVSKVHWSETIDRLTSALALALESTRIDGRLTGALIEKGPGEWAVTTAGIENVDHGVVASAAAFPGPVMSAVATAVQRRSGEKFHEPWMDLERPDWAEPCEWEYMIARARKVLPGANLPALLQTPYVGSMKEPRRPGSSRSGLDFSGV